jgi:hypothetical protein
VKPTILSFFLFVSAVAHGAEPASVAFKPVATVLDRIMQREPGYDRIPKTAFWNLYGQNDTSAYLHHDGKGLATGAFLQFGIAHDKRRDQHYQQCLPIAKYLIATLLPNLKMSIADIDSNLQTARTEKRVLRFNDGERVIFFRYKFSEPEDKDTYACYRIEIGGKDLQVSTDK